jgi:hypothetical protein
MESQSSATILGLQWDSRSDFQAKNILESREGKK